MVVFLRFVLDGLDSVIPGGRAKRGNPGSMNTDLYRLSEAVVMGSGFAG